MRRFLSFAMVLCLCVPAVADQVPTGEKAIIAYLTGKGAEIKVNEEGNAERLMHSGRVKMSANEYALIGKLTHLQQIGINAAPLTAGEWEFLKSLKDLKSLSIWHCAQFADLSSFSGLPVESLTVGGCMGIRNFNLSEPDKQRQVLLSLTNLPNIKKLNLYHSPLAPEDSALVHVAHHFPTLEDLRLDFAAPRNTETSITPDGLRSLQKLPLKVFNLEHAVSFTNDHFDAIAEIETLEALLIDARKSAAPAEAIKHFQRVRPDVAVVVAGPDASGPPRVTRQR